MLGNATPLKARTVRVLLAWMAAAVALATQWGCGSSGSTTTAVTISPTTAGVLINQTLTFTVTVTGPTNTDVTWPTTVSGTGCTGTPNPCGTLSGGTHNTTTTNTIVYTAPATVPTPSSPPTITFTVASVADPKATATATIAVGSGIVITVSPSGATINANESWVFNATVTNDAQAKGLTWTVSDTTAGTITPGTCQTVTATPPQQTCPATFQANAKTGTFTLTATAVADTTRTGTATVTVVTAADPTLSSISPHVIPQGGPLQDLYLTGTNLISSTIVFIDEDNVTAVVPSANVSEVVVANTNAIRVRLTSAFLATAGSHTVRIQKQGGTPLSCTGTAPCSFQTVSVRPSLVSSSPASTLQQGQFSSTIQVDGGYFGAPSSPVVTASFEGSVHSVLPTSPRQITVLLDALELKTPGLHPLAIQNVALQNDSAKPPSMAVTNVAVQPDPNVNAPTPLLGSPIAMPPSSAPSAIAVDSTIGRAVVALKGTNQVQLLNVTPGSPPTVGVVTDSGNPIAVGNSPTGLALDYSLQSTGAYHHAVVVNNASRDVWVVDIQNSPFAVLGKIDLSAVTPGTTGAAPVLPFSVGVDPDSHLGLVAYQSAKTGSIINVGPTLPAGASCILGGTPPYCVIGQVTLNTGDSPQIAFEPHLRWAMVTPGGSGLMSYVTLGPQQGTPIPILSVARSADVVTVTTATNHDLNPTLSSPQTVLITGVTDDTSFDGTFTVASVPTATTFTFSQTGADKTVSNSDGSAIGTLYFSDPLVTFSIGPTVQGIAISPETFTAVLTDRNASQAYLVSTISQTVRSVTLTEGSSGEPVLGGVAAAFQPYTNVAVVVSNLKNEIFLIDPVAPGMLGGSTVSLSTNTNPIPTGGTGSSAVAIDPPTNLALVANSTSNDVSAILLSGNSPPIKPLHINEVRISDPARILTAGFTFTSANNLDIDIFGSGFSGSPQVQLDGSNAGINIDAAHSDARHIAATIPSSYLTAPRRFALQVSNGGVVSNAENFSVVQSIDFSGESCGTSNPSQLAAVGIDADRDLAVVTNAGCNYVALIDLSPTDGKIGQIIGPVIGVGTAPEGVAVISRLGLAVVTNRNIDVNTLLSLGTGTVSLVNLDAHTLIGSDITVGTEPLAVDVDQDAGTALVANFGSNSMSVIDLVAALADAAASPPTTPTPITFSVNQRPTALAIDPDLHLAAVLNSASSTIDLMNTVAGGITNSIPTLANLFTGVAFDPVAGNGNGKFYATAADFNFIYVVDPSAGTATPIPGGINPGPIAFNYQTGGIVAVNPGSNTMSIFDAQNLSPQAVFGPVTGTAQTAATSVAQQFGVAIHPRTNLAVVVDQPNNRVLLMPLPK